MSGMTIGMTDFVQFGDCRETLRHWIVQGRKVQMCVTSPPYFGLRNYGVAGQVGQEKSPDEYVSCLVSIFRIVRELLADDGSLWLNIGDTYASNGSGGHGATGGADKSTLMSAPPPIGVCPTKRSVPEGLKTKDLIGIPWMLAFALRADGWYLRQDIIWHKPNPMPESVRDRCTKAHEYLFLLSKALKYYFDCDAIKTPLKDSDEATREKKARFGGKDKHAGFGTRIHGGREYFGTPDGKANKRSVWSITTKPFRGAHFAAFPPDLVEPCILAGSRPGDTVLDPFMGSGTTAQVALQHGRHYLGCELNPAYKELIDKRLESVEVAA